MKAESRRFWIDGAIGLALIGVTAAAYAPSLRFDFVNFDDPTYASENPRIAAGLVPASLAYAWSTFDLGNWIPLTWMSLELDAALFGVNPAAFHAMNALWHALSVCLLYLVLRRMTGARGRSAAVALLFAVHPLHVESVAWISERKDVLSAFWLLVTLLAYERYAARPSVGRMALVALTLALGLLAKSMLVTLPVLLLVADFWPLRRTPGTQPAAEERPGGEQAAPRYPPRSWTALLLEKTPLFLLAAADGLVTIAAQRTHNAVSGLDRVPLALRLGNAVYAYGWYLGKTFWPTGLCAFYPHPLGSISWPLVAASGAALVAISLWVAWRAKARGYLAFGWLWFLIALLPVCGLMQVGGQAYADRYAYIPHLGLFTLVVWQVADWLVAWRAQRWPAILLAGASAIALGALSTCQLATWRNSETLWTRRSELYPNNFGAHAGMGLLRLNQERWDEAQDHFQRVLAEQPAMSKSIFYLGWIHQQRKEWELAREYYRWTLRVNPQHADAARFLASLPDGPAGKSPGNAARKVPGAAALAENRQGLALARRGDFTGALTHFRQAVALDAGYAEGHNNAALALKELKRPDEARQHLERAIDADPENADFHVNLASLLESVGARREAREHYEAAVRLKPHDVEARRHLERLKKSLK